MLKNTHTLFSNSEDKKIFSRIISIVYAPLALLAVLGTYTAVA
jgi:hypothetical protein